MNDEREDLGHLSAEQIQALLDGELPGRERAHVEGHVHGCARCASELQAWRGMFEGLETLPSLEPSAAFTERVLQEVPARRPFLIRIGERIAAFAGIGSAASATRRHPKASVLQDLADGVLGGRGGRVVAAHVASCERCRTELESWEAVIGRLSALPHIQPSPEFAEGVMTRVRLPTAAPASTPFWRRLLDAVGGLVPKTPRGWALAGGAGALPAALMVVLVAFLLTHPVLTPIDLAAFLWWRVTDAVSFATAWAAGWLLEHSLATQAVALAESILSAPGVAAATLAGAWALSAGALWILYRNLYARSHETERHVHA